MFNIKYPWLKKYLDYFYTDKLATLNYFLVNQVLENLIFFGVSNLFMSQPLNFLILWKMYVV